MSSPTQRTNAILKKWGWDAAIVEKWNMHAKVRQDLFGCIDILAMQGGVLIGIQACAMSSISARLDKALSLPTTAKWLATGNLFEVWGWGKRGGRGKRKRWTLTRQPVIGPRDLIPRFPGEVITRDAIYLLE